MQGTERLDYLRQKREKFLLMLIFICDLFA